MPYPPLNAEPYVHEVHNRIYVRCSEDLKSVCDAKLLHLEFDSKRCAGQHISASDHGVTCNNFVIDAPLPSCVKNCKCIRINLDETGQFIPHSHQKLSCLKSAVST